MPNSTTNAKSNLDIIFIYLLSVIAIPVLDGSNFKTFYDKNTVFTIIALVLLVIFLIVHTILFRKRIFNFFKANYYLASPFLIFLSFPTFDVWILKGFPFFAWISLVPFFVYVRGKPLKQVFGFSFVIGLLSNFLAYEWIGNFAGNMPGGYPTIVSALIPSLSVFFMIRIFAAEILSQKFEKLRFLIYPAAWIFVDFVMSIGYLAFPWIYWGYSQYTFTPFIQLASFTGIMGINFVVILGNYCISDLLYHKIEAPEQSREELLKTPAAIRLFILAAFVALTTICGLIILTLNDREIKKDLRVSIVQSCISPWENWHFNKFKYLAELKKYTLESLSEEPDFLIWSESATLEWISYNYENQVLNSFQEQLFDFVRLCDKPLITGEIGVIRSKSKPGKPRSRLRFQNNAVLINKYGEVVDTYPKINLVPIGEWVPYAHVGPLGKALKTLANDYGGSNFVPGEKPKLFKLLKKKFAVLICYEGMFFRLCRKYKNMGADYLITVTNDGWTDKYRGHMQHFSASPFRAIENGIWQLRSGNTGYTTIIDPYGRVVNSIPILQQDFLVGDIDFSFNHETFYSRFGDIFLYIAMTFLGIVVLSFIAVTIREKMKKTG
ncbi:MAG: apolipoprotein N-acyltransferase [bacterium]|nr:apolipoprotein N-acyltransferase [bacterium]